MQTEFKYKFKILPVNDPYMGYTHILRMYESSKKAYLNVCIDMFFLTKTKSVFATLRNLRSLLKSTLITYM